MGLISDPNVELSLSISTAVLNSICVSHGLLCGDICIACTVRLITLLMQNSLTVIPVSTNWPLSNNCTQCTVGADSASVYKVQLLS